MLKKSKGQSTAEYAIIIAVVIGAAVAMQTYVKRGLQARQKAGTDAFTNVTAAFTSESGIDAGANFAAMSQYEPYYLETSNDRFQETIEQEHMGDGKIVKEKVSDVSATSAGSIQKQATAIDQATRDAQWK